MEEIRVTFPVIIPIEKVISILEGNIKKNSEYTCEVVFDGTDSDENVFIINSRDGAGVFYLIGITAGSMLDKYCSNTPDGDKR